MRLRTVWGWTLLLVVVCGVGGRLNSAFPSPKTWWTKQITRQLYTAGRLTDRQMKYAVDAGFRTLVSLYHFEDNVSIGGEQLLSTAASRDVAVRVSGINFVTMSGVTSLVEVLQKFAEIKSRAPTPILVYCRTGRLASFVSLASMMAAGLLTSDDVMTRGAALGYDFGSMQHFRAALATLSGRSTVMASAVPQVTLPQWQWLWAMKPVYRNWYVMGQIQRNDANRLRQTGIGTVINCRAGVKMTSGEIPSQEEVNLLNIADFTGTYYAGGRQTRRRLTMTRIDPEKSNEYINVNSRRNYESRNEAEYGDEIGYNETLERTHMQWAGLQYHHTPVRHTASNGMYVYSRSDVDFYLSTWVNAAVDRNVVVHCYTGYKAVQVALIGAGRQYGLTSAWALRRARELGYHYDTEAGQPVVKLLRAVLG